MKVGDGSADHRGFVEGKTESKKKHGNASFPCGKNSSRMWQVGPGGKGVQCLQGLFCGTLVWVGFSILRGPNPDSPL